MSRRTVVVVGDVLLDRDVVGRAERLCPDAPVPVVDVETELQGPGGAGLTALLCRAPGTEVVLVAAVGADPEGEQVRRALATAGVELVGLAHEGRTRTKTRVRSGGQTLLRLDTGGPGAPHGSLPEHALGAIDAADVVLVSCYGAGMSDHDQLREVLERRAPRRPVVWDPHPRGAPPVPRCTVVTPNLAEARSASGLPQGTPDAVGRHLVAHWSAGSVCVTAGATGAWLVPEDGEPLHLPTRPVEGDPCGAGDRFAAALATALAHGCGRGEAVLHAVEAASHWVAQGGTSGFRTDPEAFEGSLHPTPPAQGRLLSRRSAAGLPDTTSEAPEALEALGAPLVLGASEVIERTRAGGGTVVMTGGCFDILHAGHVACLEAARDLGDSLVVLLNSDESVRALKGPGRPVQPAADRARVLRGLSCVDAVVEFDEPTPERLLARLRPDVWVKGGDYEGTDLPEARLVRSWGGRVALLPYLSGHSTTAILARSR